MVNVDSTVVRLVKFYVYLLLTVVCAARWLLWGNLSPAALKCFDHLDFRSTFSNSNLCWFRLQVSFTSCQEKNFRYPQFLDSFWHVYLYRLYTMSMGSSLRGIKHRSFKPTLTRNLFLLNFPRWEWGIVPAALWGSCITVLAVGIYHGLTMLHHPAGRKTDYSLVQTWTNPLSRDPLGWLCSF